MYYTEERLREAVEEARELIREYTDWFGRDLSFQSLDDELNHVESKYLPPEGRLVVAVDDDGVVCGCVAYHRLDEGTAEMKRLYVKELCQIIQDQIGVTREDIYAVRIHDKYSFVSMSQENCDKAIGKMNGMDIKGRTITVTYSNKE